MQEAISDIELELLKTILEGLDQVNKQLDEAKVLVKGHEVSRDYFLTILSKRYNLSADDQITLDGNILRNSFSRPEVISEG